MVRAAILLILLAACSGVDDDLGEPTDAVSGPTCRELFGTAPEFMPCGEEADRCAFFTSGGTRSCDAVCGEHDAECASSYLAVDSCDPDSGDQGCAVPHAAQICVCLR